MAKIGYSCVSTSDQSMDLQIDSLKAAWCERIFEKKSDRLELARCLEVLRYCGIHIAMIHLNISTSELSERMVG